MQEKVKAKEHILHGETLAKTMLQTWHLGQVQDTYIGACYVAETNKDQNGSTILHDKCFTNYDNKHAQSDFLIQ